MKALTQTNDSREQVSNENSTHSKNTARYKNSDHLMFLASILIATCYNKKRSWAKL